MRHDLDNFAGELADWSEQVDRRLRRLEGASDPLRGGGRILGMTVVVRDDDGAETHGARVESVDMSSDVLTVRLPADPDQSLGGQLNHVAKRIRDIEASLTKLIHGYTGKLAYIENFDEEALAHYIAVRLEGVAE